MCPSVCFYEPPLPAKCGSKTFEQRRFISNLYRFCRSVDVLSVAMDSSSARENAVTSSVVPILFKYQTAKKMSRLTNLFNANFLEVSETDAHRGEVRMCCGRGNPNAGWQPSRNPHRFIGLQEAKLGLVFGISKSPWAQNNSEKHRALRQ